LNCANIIGSKVDDPVLVQLLDFECSNEINSTDNSNTVMISNIDDSPRSFSYEIDILKSNIGSDPEVFVYASGPSNGEVKFCTRVSTWEGSIQIAMRETQFTFRYDLRNNNFTMSLASITNATRHALDTLVEVDAGVFPCQCSNFDCVSSTPIAQNSMIEICLEPTKSTTHITNFDFKIDAGTDYSYNPVAFGTNGWETTNSATVVREGEGANSDKIMITTPVVPHFFIENHAVINVSGNVFLEFKDGKTNFADFEMYEMQIGLVQTGYRMGCLKRLFSRFGLTF